MREICERKNYEDHLEKIKKEVEKENLRPIRLVPLAGRKFKIYYLKLYFEKGVHQDELRAVRRKIARKGKEAKK